MFGWKCSSGDTTDRNCIKHTNAALQRCAVCGATAAKLVGHSSEPFLQKLGLHSTCLIEQLAWIIERPVDAPMSTHQLTNARTIGNIDQVVG
jgi:hypothetical protein